MIKNVLLTITALSLISLTACVKNIHRPPDELCPKMVKANGVDICTESFGKTGDPAVLLIMGATASMISWEDDFCRQLAGGGRYVIRYDNRDTGCSVTYPTGQPQYNLDDMVRDAVGVLDAYGIGSAHLAGASLGGMIAQLAAIEHPERLLSLTLIMTSPHGPEDPDLPPMSEKILTHFQKTASSVDWSDQAAVLKFRIETMRVLTGSGRSFDEQGARSLVEREAKRAINVSSSLTNHSLIASNRWRERLGEVQTPTLVIHGTDDPVLPFGHGEALSKEIRGAKLLPLNGAGHELHRDDWDVIIREMLRHMSPVR
jgi:pimeloyl-ACP methyl ester carboxylesterase